MINREAVLKTGEDLYRAMIPYGPFYGSLVEVELYNGAVILGGSGYLGFIDDISRQITLFNRGSALERHALDEVYGPFIRSGYKATRLKNERFLGRGDDSEVIQFIVDKDLPLYLTELLDRKTGPRAFGIVMTDAEADRSYEYGNIIGAAAALAGGLGEALAISATYNGKGLLRALPNPETSSTESRVKYPIDWDQVIERRRAAEPQLTLEL